MKKGSVHVYILIFVLLFSIVLKNYCVVFAEEQKISNDAYDSITWKDVNRKREERDEGNFFTKTYWWMFKRHTEKTYTGDDIEVVQTASNQDLDDNDSPLRIVHVTGGK